MMGLPIEDEEASIYPVWWFLLFYVIVLGGLASLILYNRAQ